MPLAPGDVIAGYTILRQLGTGGMGAVYLVRHPRLPRSDAMKLLRPELSSDPDFAARFLREADVVAGLSHPNIVSVLDRGEDAGHLWLTMQYVDGIDAETALEQAGGLLPADRAVHIVAGVAAALDCAHRQNIVHRDVKPANVLLAPPAETDDPEHVFLTDFGIAKSLDGAADRLTRTGMVVATFDYASPEQIESKVLDARADVYSLGCLLYKLLTGTVPFPGETVLAALHGHLNAPPPRPTDAVPWLPPALDDVVARAMAKDPADRFPTCRALAAAATQALAALPEPPGPPYRIALTKETAQTAVVVGPVDTQALGADETERLVDLVRRTRFFALPEHLAGGGGPTSAGWAPERGSVRVEITAGGTTHQVRLDLANPRRPPDLPALVAAVEAAEATRSRAPRTVTELPAVPPPPPAPPPRPVTAAARTELPPATPVPSPASFPPPASRPPPAAPIPPGSGSGSAIPYVRGRPPRRSPWILAAVAVAVLVAAGGTFWLMNRATDPPGTGDPEGTSGSTATATATAPPAQQALEDLPRGDPLPGPSLVTPRDDGGNVDLVVVDTSSGATTTALTSGPEQDIGPLISPDRQTVVYQQVAADGGVTLRAVAVDGAGDRPLFDDGGFTCPSAGRPAWNPADPTQLAVTCGPGGSMELRLVTLDGATVRTLDPGVLHIGDLSFSPDGTRVLYWGNDDPQVDGGNLYALPVDGGSGPQQLTDVGPGIDADAVWSPDGTRIAFRRIIAPGQSRIFVMDADGSDQQQLTSGSAVDQDPIFSPDGSMIAFKSNRPGEAEPPGNHVWVMEATGANLRQLDDQGGTATNAPAWGNR